MSEFDAAFNEIVQDIEPKPLTELITEILAKLKAKGWKISESTNTPEKILEGMPFITVQPPNSNMWCLMELRLKKQRRTERNGKGKA